MKTKQFTLLVIGVFIFGTLQLDAQTASVIEKRIGNTVYELDTVSYSIKNKANKISEKEINTNGCKVSFDNYSKEAETNWKENFKPIFSKERAEELNFRINITSICDSTGLIREIEIFFGSRENFEKVTLSEIKAIEDAAKTYRYKDLSWYDCEELKYVRIYHHRLNPYLLYFEKPKK